MTTRARLFLLLVALFCGGFCGGLGCAAGSSSTEAVRHSAARQVVAMDQDRLERLFADQVDAIAGPPGVLQSKVDGIRVYCISDSASDRMRIVAPIRPLTGLDPRLLEVLLRANFHISRDARYAISEDFVFAAFVHPISSLSPELIASALDQVVTLAKNFGTTYSSRNLAAPVLDSEILDDPQ